MISRIKFPQQYYSFHFRHLLTPEKWFYFHELNFPNIITCPFLLTHWHIPRILAGTVRWHSLGPEPREGRRSAVHSWEGTWKRGVGAVHRRLTPRSRNRLANCGPRPSSAAAAGGRTTTAFYLAETTQTTVITITWSLYFWHLHFTEFAISFTQLFCVYFLFVYFSSSPKKPIYENH